MCLSDRQPNGLTGVSCYLCQYSFSPATGKKVTGKTQKFVFENCNSINLLLFSETEQLNAKLLSHSSNTVGHH